MKKKTFDSIEMKNEIQRELQQECKGLSPEERRRRMSERILSDPVLAPLYLRTKERERQKQMMVAEVASEYQIRKD